MPTCSGNASTGQPATDETNPLRQSPTGFRVRCCRLVPVQLPFDPAECSDVATDAAPPPAGVLPRQPDASRQPLWLAAAATISFTATTALVGFLGLLLLRTSVASLFAPFGGWQLYVVEVALALPIMAVGAVAGRAVVRRYRDLRGRTPYRRAVVMAALLPGLLAGGLALTPMRAAFSWASEHTAEATTARHRYETWLNN